LGGWIATGEAFAKRHIAGDGTKPTPDDIRAAFETAWDASGEDHNDWNGNKYKNALTNFKKGAAKVRAGKRANPNSGSGRTQSATPDELNWFYQKGHRLGAENGPVGRSAERARFAELFKMSGLPVSAKTKAGVQFERGFANGVQESYKRGNPAPASPYHSAAYKAAVKIIGNARAGQIIGEYMTAHANDPVQGDWKTDSYRMEQEAVDAVIAAANATRGNPAPRPRLRIKFTVDRNGRRTVYVRKGNASLNTRWIRISEAEANDYIARGEAMVEPAPGASNAYTNPAPAAAALYESWTGLPSTHETIVVEKVFDHGHLTDLARLVSFKLRGVRGRLKFTDPTTRLCVNETGTQLYIRGGDQTIPLDDFNRAVTSPSRKVDPTKESVVLGEITNVYYAAKKPFLGGEHKHLGIYDHKLGGKNRNFPTLVYDTRSQLLSISGGVYYIKPDDYDGKHSRGIVD